MMRSLHHYTSCISFCWRQAKQWPFVWPGWFESALVPWRRRRRRHRRGIALLSLLRYPPMQTNKDRERVTGKWSNFGRSKRMTRQTGRLVCHVCYSREWLDLTSCHPSIHSGLSHFAFLPSFLFLFLSRPDKATKAPKAHEYECKRVEREREKEKRARKASKSYC